MVTSSHPAPRPTAPVAGGVLAGARPGIDAIAEAEGTAGKVFVDIAGVPMLQRVLDVMAAVTDAGPVHLCGPERVLLESAPWLAEREAQGAVSWQPPQPSPARGAGALVKHAFGFEPQPAALFLTTGDHPLLTIGTARRFVTDALSSGAEVVVGLARHAQVQAAFPGSRRTALRLADGPFCSCNLFLIRSAPGAAVLEFWQRLEVDRKHPKRMAKAFGLGIVLRYLAGRLTSRVIMARLEALTGVSCAAVIVDDPDAAVDVDSPEDLATVRARWQVRAG